MRVTQWGEYGVLCAMCLAEHARVDDSPLGAVEIASELGIAPEYVQQVLQRLRKGGVVNSIRGPHGGYRLTRPAEKISLRDILVAAEGSTFELICETRPLSPEQCADDVPCSLRVLWHDLREHIDSFLYQKTLDQLGSVPRSQAEPVQLGRG